jgi:ABC-2 type transport system permease protein
MLSIVLASVRAQWRLTKRNVEDLLPVLTMPLFTFVFMAVFDYSGRSDLAGYAFIAPLLLTVGQMGFFVASEILSRERSGQTLEMVLVTPAPFLVVLFPRIALLTTVGLLGFVEGWLVLRLVFGTDITIHHSELFAVTIFLTVLASACTALITAALFCLGPSVRTFQTSIQFPIFLLGGVIVPVTFLPEWIQPFSRGVFLYWAANLMRDALVAESPADVWQRLTAIALLSLVAILIGALLLKRILFRLRRDGVIGVF